MNKKVAVALGISAFCISKSVLGFAPLTSAYYEYKCDSDNPEACLKACDLKVRQPDETIKITLL